MIDAKIIGMSEMKKYKRTEVFWIIIVELMAGFQSNIAFANLIQKRLLFSDENLKNQTAIEVFSFFTLKQLHKNMNDGWII